MKNPPCPPFQRGVAEEGLWRMEGRMELKRDDLVEVRSPEGSYRTGRTGRVIVVVEPYVKVLMSKTRAKKTFKLADVRKM